VQHPIFISYRRTDSDGQAGRLYDHLVRAFGDDTVFMDAAGIAPGLDFRKAIDDQVSRCGVFLAVIGPEWARITGADGGRRLDDPNDFVRLEIASALAFNVAVIPVLVNGAEMPNAHQLPDNIRGLAYRQGVGISHARWNSDVQLLISVLRDYDPTKKQPSHAAVSVQLPAEGDTPTSQSSTAEEKARLAVLRKKQQEEQTRRAAIEERLKEAQESVEAKAARWNALENGPVSDATRQPVTFICYSHEDAAFARKLAQDLRNKGARVWMDKLDIRPGQPYRKKIDEALRSCDRMIVIVSPSSVESDEVTSEYTSFLKRKKAVIPVLYKECEMPYRLDTFEYADFLSQEYEEAMEELLLSLIGD
jgi:hypothetical protein